MDNFDGHFLENSPLGIDFDEEHKFFDVEADQEDLYQQLAVEESIYTDDAVQVYLREIGASAAAHA